MSNPNQPDPGSGTGALPPVETTAPAVESLTERADAQSGVGSPAGQQSHQPRSTSDVAKDEAGALTDSAKQQGHRVAEEAKAQAGQVTAEAKRQAGDLAHQAQYRLTEQAGEQQHKAALGIRSLSDELDSMATNSDQHGVATDLVHAAAGRLSEVAGWLENRDTQGVLDDVRRYARRNPGSFLLMAGAAGLIVGRLSRGLRDAGQDGPGSRGRGARHPGARYDHDRSYGAGHSEFRDADSPRHLAAGTAQRSAVPAVETVVPGDEVPGWESPDVDHDLEPAIRAQSGVEPELDAAPPAEDVLPDVFPDDDPNSTSRPGSAVDPRTGELRGREQQ